MLYQMENPHGGDIYSTPIRIDFSASINPLGTPPEVLSAMCEALKRSEHYPDPYCRKAVRAISNYEDIPEEYILNGNGAAELIYTFCDAVKPRKALIPVPTFSEYEAALRRTDCDIIYYPLTVQNDFLPDDGLPKAIREISPQVISLCNPNNPTGRLYPADQLENILSVCGKMGIILFVDESFLELSDRPNSMKSFLSKHPNLFILKSFTKTYALAGIRIGYCLCSDRKLLTRMSRLAQPWNVSSVAQAAVEAIPANKEEYLEKTQRLISSEREWLTEQLCALGCKIIPSEANYILFKAKAGLDVSMREKSIAIRNCANYVGLEDGWYRISVRNHSENEMLIHTMAEVIG